MRADEHINASVSAFPCVVPREKIEAKRALADGDDQPTLHRLYVYRSVSTPLSDARTEQKQS
jgi:hypothetical protein